MTTVITIYVVVTLLLLWLALQVGDWRNHLAIRLILWPLVIARWFVREVIAWWREC